MFHIEAIKSSSFERYHSKRKVMKRKKGFSLIELLVVVSIIGLMSAIAIPTYSSFIENSRKTTYKSDLLAFHKSWITFSTERNSFQVRTTAPVQSSIETVGMGHLFNHELFGEKAEEINFIGFSGENTGTNRYTAYTGGSYELAGGADRTTLIYTNENPITDKIKHEAIGIADNTSNAGTSCKVGGKSYTMGVVNFVSAGRGVGYNINQDGVFKDKESVFGCDGCLTPAKAQTVCD